MTPIKYQTLSRISTGQLAVFICCCCWLALDSNAKPLNNDKIKPKTISELDSKDPLESLPSDSSQQTVVYEQQQQPNEPHDTEIQYVYQAQPEAASYAQEMPQIVEIPQQGHPSRQMRVVQPNAYAQAMENRPQVDERAFQQAGNGQSPNVDCLDRHEYVSLASLADQQPRSRQESSVIAMENNDHQDGDIMYVNQNGNVKEATTQVVGDAMSKASGMPATILTEVPANEMPREVLEKLKRDYGVKVVATRERPGANLVINCDDYSNVDSSICAQQAQPMMRDHPMRISGHEMNHEIAIDMPRYAVVPGEQELQEPRGPEMARLGGSRHQSRTSHTMDVISPTGEVEQPMQGYVTQGGMHVYTTEAEMAKHNQADDDSTHTATIETTRPMTSLVRTTMPDEAYGTRTTPPADYVDVSTQVNNLTETTGYQVEPNTASNESSDNNNTQEVGFDEQKDSEDQKHHPHHQHETTGLHYYTRQPIAGQDS